MKPIVFIAAGLLVGLAGGTFVGGSKEKGVVLERIAAEKAAAAALQTDEHTQDAHTTPEAAPEGGEAGPDSLEAGTGESGGGEGGHAEPDPEAGEAAPGTHEAAPGEGAPPPETGAETGYAAATAGVPATPGGGGGSVPGEALSPQGPERLAKIFGAMEAEDAAAVLQKLTDDEIRPILLNMSDRKVAAILGSFVPERAASLSRTVLEDRSGIDR